MANRDLGEYVKLVFSTNGRVDRRTYLLVGLGLGILKYVVESSVLSYASGRFYTPLDFVSPFFSTREPFVATAPLALTLAWMVWTLPFLWIGVSMTVRRAFDSRVSPWWALSILVPFVNLLAMLIFACLPSREPQAASEADEGPKEESNPFEVKGDYNQPPVIMDRKEISGVFASVLGILAGTAYLIVLVLLSVYVLQSYGAAMFFGAPIVTCATAAFYLNRHRDRGIGRTILHSLATLLVACMAFLLLGIEGGICILMAIPIFAPLGLLGATVGFGIAVSCHRSRKDETMGLYGCLVVLPLIGFVESRLDQSPVLEVRSEVVIEAPAARVWEHVIRFPDITSQPTGILATGVAYRCAPGLKGRGSERFVIVSSQRGCLSSRSRTGKPRVDYRLM